MIVVKKQQTVNAAIMRPASVLQGYITAIAFALASF
jgi:hypothetical protein